MHGRVAVIKQLNANVVYAYVQKNHILNWNAHAWTPSGLLCSADAIHLLQTWFFREKKCISLYWINSNQQQHECYFIPYSPNQAAIKNLDISWLLPRSKPVVSAPVSSLCYNKCTVLAMVRNVTVQLISSTVIWWSLSCLLHETGNPTLAEYGCPPYATGYYGSWQSQVLLTNISDRSKQRSTQAERFNIVKKAFSNKERKTLSSSFGNWKTKITLQKHITVFL